MSIRKPAQKPTGRSSKPAGNTAARVMWQPKPSAALRGAMRIYATTGENPLRKPRKILTEEEMRAAEEFKAKVMSAMGPEGFVVMRPTRKEPK